MLTGYYGRGNFGDDFILSSLVDFIADRTDLVVEVLSGSRLVKNNWRATRATVLPRTLTGYLRGIRRVDAVMVGGGTIFHDSNCGRHRLRYWFVLVLWLMKLTIARALHKRVLIAGAGVGPLRSRTARILSALSFRQCSKIGVRDTASATTLAELGFADKTLFGFDLAILGHARVRAAANGERDSGPVIGVAPVSFTIFTRGGEEYTVRYWDHFVRALERQMEFDRRLQVRVFALSRGGQEARDDGIARQIVDCLRLSFPGRVEIHRYDGDVWATVQAIAGCRWFIASRYHSLLTAYLCGCYVAAVPYNRKVRDLALQIGLGDEAIIPVSRIITEREWGVLLQRLSRDDPLFVPTLAPDEAAAQAEGGLAGVIAGC